MDIESNITENNDSIQSNIETTFAMPLGATVVNSDLSLSQYIADGGTFTVPDSIIKNSDDTFSVAVPAAQPYELADVEHTDTNGDKVTLPAMTPMVCTPATCSGADVTNSDNTYSAHINDGDTLVLADVPNVDSTGDTVMTPAMTPFVATPAAPPGEQFYVLFPALYKSTVDMAVDASSAGTYAYEQSANTSSVAYEVNGTPVTMPFTVVDGDILTVTIVKDDEDCLAVVEITNIAVTPYTFSSGNYVSAYPPAQNATYVKATTTLAGGLEPYLATDPTKSLTGNYFGTSWLSSSATNQRFHIDLGSAKVIGRIYYENIHTGGANTLYGCKNFTLWGSNSASDFADLTYANDGTWTQITGLSQSYMEAHISNDTADPKYIIVPNETAYRYYAFKFADSHGGGTFMGLRRIELQE